MNDKNYIEKRVCEAVSPYTGKQCNAQCVKFNTVKTGTKEFLNPKYCQMHQDFESDEAARIGCKCPKCMYHRVREAKMVQYAGGSVVTGENGFGKKLKKVGTNGKR